MNADHAASRLRGAIRLLMRRAQALAGEGDPTRSELDVMTRLEDQGPLTPGTLATAMRVKPQTMGQTLDLLDRHHWITRSPDPKDRRRVFITLSRTGREAVLRGRAVRQAWLSSALGKLDAREKKTMADAIAILERIAREETSSYTPSTS